MQELILPEISNYSQEIEKIRAAYALNVCAVSVSQIVDYNDQYILDQEYENTLNNLNLEMMPKDEAFLDILTETLNVVTFFKIYSSKKKQIEEKYQQKVKNAIWSAVPNLAFVISSGGMGGVYALIGSLATEVGLGYMNYRKTKAENELEYKSNQLELEYTAIEQLNAIRTKLFVTSWRIAEKYDFSDNYRLTEKQINQFNDILMDSNILRRYSRLFSIRHNYIAYPPFWYYLGNAANLIYQSDDSPYSKDYRENYRRIAESAYDYYLKLNDTFSVLRSDETVSACALEYCSLLPIEACDKKVELLQIATKWAGERNDVVQMCAFEYLKMERFNEAEALFKTLVDERYSEELNSQVLSSIYANSYYRLPDSNIALEYSVLAQQVPSTVLFPLPIRDNEAKTQSELWNVYMLEQKGSLSASSKRILDNYIEKFNYRLNKMIMNFDCTKQYPDLMFLSDGDEIRDSEANRIFSRPLIVADYINNLQNVNYPISLVDTLNEMVDGLKPLSFLNVQKCVQLLESEVSQHSEQIEKLQECINSRDVNYEKYREIFEPLTFDRITKGVVTEIKYQMDAYINTFADMKDIINMEVIMNNFVENNEIKSFDRDLYAVEEPKKNWFVIDASVVGKTAISVKTEKDTRQRIEDLIRTKVPYIIQDQTKVKVYFQGEPEFDIYFAQTVNILSSKTTKENLKRQTIAIIDDVSGLSFDLLFTYNSVVPCYTHRLCQNIEYKYVRYDDQGKQLYIGGEIYSVRSVDMLKLARCIEEIANAKEEVDNSDNGKSSENGSSDEPDMFNNQNAKSSKIQMIKKCSRCETYLPETADICFKCGCSSLLTVPNVKNIQF